MDVTFEEVAHVIQDARYQQAIFDCDIPRPEKRLPRPPQPFDVEEFVRSNRIGLGLAVSEPLGRYFMRRHIDREIPAGERAETAIKLLAFADGIYQLRAQDSAGLVPMRDTLALMGKYELPLSMLEFTGSPPAAKLSTLVSSLPPKPESLPEESALSTEVMGVLPKPNDRQGRGALDVDSVEIELPAEPPRGARQGSVSGSVSGSSSRDLVGVEVASSSRSSVAPPPILVAARTSIAAEGHVSTASFGPEAVSTLNQRSVVVSGVFSTQGVLSEGASTPTGSCGGTVASSLLRSTARQQAHRHGNESFRLKSQIDTMLERNLKTIYEDFASGAEFEDYLWLKWYSLQIVDDRHVRYHRALGTGAFGTVSGCIVAPVGCMLANKTMQRKRIKAKRARQQVVAEHAALTALAKHPSPYCMRLRYAYQTKQAFHLLLPLAIGGDLKYHLRDGAFDENRARLYAAEIALGLGHIHSIGIVIRDLKPRNILLTSEGHCQISDLGLAVEVGSGRAVKGRAGTEGYWSPEVIDGKFYAYDADWWSYGVCLFELLAGFGPFSCSYTKLRSRNEGTRRARVDFPERVKLARTSYSDDDDDDSRSSRKEVSFPSSAKPLILGLLTRKVESRLGCSGGAGADAVLDSNRFAFWSTQQGFDLAPLRRFELEDVEVPWVPERGVIYAMSQGEIAEDEELPVELAKVKWTAEDDIEGFVPFVEIDGHQRDIIRAHKAAEVDGKRYCNGPLHGSLRMLDRMKSAFESHGSAEVPAGCCACS